ncbi:hypothetical protein A2U01_0085766, partial [Trifolium medium]|nr:hypothetical protein [Trifolium medium]
INGFGGLTMEEATPSGTCEGVCPGVEACS